MLTPTDTIRAAVNKALDDHRAVLDAAAGAAMDWSGINIFVKLADKGRDKGKSLQVTVRLESRTDLP